MKVIKARSPFSAIINVEGQVETKVELFLWNNPDTIPSLPNYTFSSKIVSFANPIGVYNLSNEIQEFLLAVIPSTGGGIHLEEYAMWCNVQVKTYYKIETDFVLDVTYNYVAVNAYRNYQDGLQNTNTVIDEVGYYLASQNVNDMNLPLADYIGGNFRFPYINILVDSSVQSNFIANYVGASYSFITESINMYRVTLLDNGSEIVNPQPATFELKTGETVILTRNINIICEIKYTPMLLSFIGKLGGWEHIYCFKAKEENIEVKDLEFKSNQDYFTFDPNIGQRQTYNLNGKKSIKINTGFVEQSTNELVEQLYLSETVVLDGLPVLLKGKTSVLKQTIKEKNINYTFEFDYNFNLINDFI